MYQGLKTSLIKIGIRSKPCYTIPNYLTERSGHMNRTAVVQIPEEQLDQVATSFIKAASGFSSQITIARGGHCVNAKSFLGFLSLMRDQGEVADRKSVV